MATISPEIQHLINLTVKSAVDAAVEQFKKILPPPEPSINNEDFLSAKQAAHFLKIELSSLYSKVEKSDFPHYRSGKRKLLFKKEELEAYVAASRSKSKQEIADEVTNDILNKNGNYRQLRNR